MNLKTVTVVGVVAVGAYFGYKYLSRDKTLYTHDIPVGVRPFATLKWTCLVSTGTIAPQFTFDLHPNFPLPRNWITGDYTQGATLSRGQSQTLVIWCTPTQRDPQMPTIPNSWKGVNVNAKICARIVGVDPYPDTVGIWEKSNVYTIV